MFFVGYCNALKSTPIDQADVFLIGQYRCMLASKLEYFHLLSSYNISVSAALVLHNVVATRLKKSNFFLFQLKYWHLSDEEVLDKKIDWAVKSSALRSGFFLNKF